MIASATMDRLRATILMHHVRVMRERVGWESLRRTRENPMPRDLESLEMAVGLFRSDMDDEAEKVFDAMDTVRAKAGGVFKRTHEHIATKANTVDNVDKLITGLDRVNASPTSGDSSKNSASSSGNGAKQSDESAEKKDEVGANGAESPPDSAEKKSE